MEFSLCVHSFPAALRGARPGRKFIRLTACRPASFAPSARPQRLPFRDDRPHCQRFASSEPAPSGASEIELATKRLAAALDALENAVERRREADRIDDDLGARIQALGADRSRLANELDGTLVRSRALERTNREIAERLDVAIDTIRSVIESGDQQP
jgi:hypothetical protein